MKHLNIYIEEQNINEGIIKDFFKIFWKGFKTDTYKRIIDNMRNDYPNLSKALEDFQNNKIETDKRKEKAISICKAFDDMKDDNKLIFKYNFLNSEAAKIKDDKNINEEYKKFINDEINKIQEQDKDIQKKAENYNNNIDEDTEEMKQNIADEAAKEHASEFSSILKLVGADKTLFQDIEKKLGDFLSKFNNVTEAAQAADYRKFINELCKEPTNKWALLTLLISYEKLKTNSSNIKINPDVMRAFLSGYDNPNIIK